MEDGLSEEEAVAALGSAEDIAAQILMELPAAHAGKGAERACPDAACLGNHPFGLGISRVGSLLLAVLSAFLAVYAAVWAVIASLFLAALSLALGLLAGGAGLVLFCVRGWALWGVLCGSAGLICGGTAILLFFAVKAAARGVAWLSRRSCRWLKTLFVRRRNAV